MIKLTDLLTEVKTVNISDIADKLEFVPVSKKKLIYKYIKDADVNKMPELSYTTAKEEQKVVTNTSDGKETENTAKKGDVIVSGATGELYVLKPDNFKKNYDGNVGEDVSPEQSDRLVANYRGESIKFKASWGEDMILKDGDYLVKEKGGKGYYRIAKKEFEKTYNKI